MSSKLDSSYAELCKLKNQIRVQLNRFRPSLEMETKATPERPSRRPYPQKYFPTTITDPPSVEKSSPNRRHFDSNGNVNSDSHHIRRQRKHFTPSYADKVDMSNTLRRSTSPYFRSVSPQPKQEHKPYVVHGVGQRDKSYQKLSGSGVRTYKERLIYKYDLI